MRLASLRYYLLALVTGPVLIPYRMAQRLRSRLRAPRSGEEDAARLLELHRLQVVPRADGAVDVQAGSTPLTAGLVDPQRPDIVFSLVYPTYKILTAAGFAILMALGAQLLLQGEHVHPRLETLLRFGHYPVLVLLLWAVYRDAVTAFVAPLPVYLVVGGLEISGRSLSIETFVAAFVALGVAYFVVDGFLVPRGLEPSLFYYDAEPAGTAHPYAPGQAPYWLAGRHYWVWRFMYVTAAELNKLWERDWERVEVWVRADGPEAGRVEWVVSDFHYRELWMPYAALVSAAREPRRSARLERVRRDPQRRAAWMVEVDMNIVFHSPEIRGLFLMPLERGWRSARIRQLLASLRARTRRHDPQLYRDRLRALLLEHDLVQDIPEHFRGYAIRQFLSLPWRYWRYARGANTTARPYFYSTPRAASPIRATEPELQFKVEPPADAG